MVLIWAPCIGSRNDWPGFSFGAIQYSGSISAIMRRREAFSRRTNSTSCGRAAQKRVDRVERRVGDGRPGAGCRWCGEHLHLAPVKRCRDAAIRQAAQRRYSAVKTSDLREGRAVEAHNGGAIRDVERLAVG